ncbi:MAG: hypothetical protein FJ095_02015 [Deltaproteobacteria bacterium]|nr:hypothetical protein [Deltaproteobacteria bacterium]
MSPSEPSFKDVPSAGDWERLGLSDSGRRAASAAIEAMLTDHAGELAPPAADWVERVVRAYDLSIGACSLQVRLGVRVLVALLEWLPLIVLGEASRMSRLSLERRIAYLEALEAHPFAPLTMLLVATKVPMLVPAFESGEALRLTGYDRETTASRRKLPLAKGPSP